MLMPHCEWHVLDELVEGAIRRVEVLLAGRSLHVRLDQGLPPIHVDGVQIQQVLVNLLDNAIKFSPPDSPIQITASLKAETLEVRVSNTGAGYPLTNWIGSLTDSTGCSPDDPLALQELALGWPSVRAS